MDELRRCNQCGNLYLQHDKRNKYCTSYCRYLHLKRSRLENVKRWKQNNRQLVRDQAMRHRERCKIND